MNIFEDYLIKIENTIKKANQDNLLELPENLSGINVDIPPPKFNGDVSTNVAMVLSKINKKPPIDVKNLITFLPPVFVLFHLYLNLIFYLFSLLQIQSYYLKNSLDQ